MTRRTHTGAFLLALLLATAARGQDLVFDAEDFATWQRPIGLVNVGEDGVTVKRFGTTFNAVADIDEHASTVIGDFGVRPVRTPSNQAAADRIRDQDPTTWWQPGAGDPLQLHWIELDLGRAVVADKVRLIFPDEEGARPFSYFSVYTSPGIPVHGGTTKRIVLSRVGRPISGNTARVVELNLQTTGLAAASGDYLDTNSTMNFDIIRFIRFEAAGITPDAALAEIEVDGVGFNLSSKVGTDLRIDKGETHWGGRTWTSKDRDCDGCGKGSGADEMLDEDVGFRTWTIEGSDKGDWRKSGVWQVVDFGSVFRINRVVYLPIVAGRSPILYGFQRDKQGSWQNLDLLTSDGTPSNSADPVTEGPYHYDLLSEVANGRNSNVDPRYRPHFGRFLFDWNFPSRDTRLLLWRVVSPEQFHRALQLFVFHAEGYPAQVELESDDIFLGGARSIRRVEWEADIPLGTSIEVETQTGNGYETLTRYFLINGSEVSKDAYEAAKSRNRGDIVEEQVRDQTWSSWSAPHRASGQDFQSPSPRQYLRARVRLISQDPDRMPVLHSLRFISNRPVVAGGLDGTVWPRESGLDSLQEFRYTIVPGGFSVGDTGYDRVVINLPRRSRDVEVVSAAVGGSDVTYEATLSGDTLTVELPPPVVRRDSVEVLLRARLAESPSVFGAYVFNSQQPASTQGVVPAVSGADRVFVPDAVAGRSLVRNLTHTSTFTPNGDNVNDQYELSFTVVKTTRDPRVRLFSLGGRMVAELPNLTPESLRASFVWNGESEGKIVPPGIYILQIEMDADARNERVHRTVHVAY